MSLRATAPSWFPPGHPQAQKMQAVDLIQCPTPPRNYCQAPGFIVRQTLTARRGPDVASAESEMAREDLQKLIGRQHPASPQPAKQPSLVQSPGGKRKIHVPGRKPAAAPTEVKRTPAAKRSQAASAAEPPSGPQEPPASPGRPSGTSSGATAKPAAQKECAARTPVGVRQQYVALFSKECLRFSSTPLEALKRARAEEKAVFIRSPFRKAYLRDAGSTLKALRGLAPSVLPGVDKATLYQRLSWYTLTEDQRKENSYPFADPTRPGRAVLCTSGDRPQRAQRRTCCRCGTEYEVSPWGLCLRLEQCHYHWGRPRRKFEAGAWEKQYACCAAAAGSVGCQVAKQHVHDGRKENLEGFVQTAAKGPSQDAHPGIYALDCEMSFTSQGLELTRVTVVDEDLRVVYDTFVKPDREIVDYNTRFSGVTEADLARTSVTLRDVQAFLLKMLSSDSILVGHSLESDLLALKMIHHRVVDTAVLFRDVRGLRYKRSLRSLVAECLHEVIQDKPDGHSSREDAGACMRLMGWKLKEDAARLGWDSEPPPRSPPIASLAARVSPKPALRTAA